MRKEAQNGKLGVYGFPIYLVPILLLTGLHPFTPKSDHLILIVSQINKAI